jgi:hypothetical protein
MVLTIAVFTYLQPMNTQCAERQSEKALQHKTKAFALYPRHVVCKSECSIYGTAHARN